MQKYKQFPENKRQGRSFVSLEDGEYSDKQGKGKGSVVPSTDKFKTTHINTHTHTHKCIQIQMYLLFTPNEMRKIRAKKKCDYRARNMQCVFRFGFFSSFVIISVGTGGGDLSFRLFLDAQFSRTLFRVAASRR